MAVKIRIGRLQLQGLLRDGGVFAGLKNTMQCLSSLKVTTHGGRIRVDSTDGDSYVCVYGVCESSEDVSFCINAKEFTSLVSLIPDEEVNILYDADKGKVTVKHQHGNVKLSATSAENYPLIRSVMDGTEVKICGSSIAEWLLMASEFVTTGQDMSVLSNVNIYANQSEIGVCGGGHHLIFTAKTENPNPSDGFSLCIPKTSACIIAKLCAVHDEVTITFNNRAMLLTTESCKIYTLLVDVKYPNIQKLFEKSGSCEISVEKEDILRSLKRINSQTVKGGEGVMISSTGSALLLTYEDGIGFERHVEEEIPCEGDAFSVVTVNSTYLLRVINNFSSPKVYFRHDDSRVSPLVFSNEYANNKELFLLAPIA